MLKRLPFFLLILFALFACKTKPAPEEIAAAEDMRTQAVEAQEKALSAEADQKAAELWQQGVDALAAGDEAAAAEDYALALQKFTEARDAFLQAYEQCGGSRSAEALEALKRAEAAISENDEAIPAGDEDKAQLDAESQLMQAGGNEC